MAEYRNKPEVQRLEDFRMILVARRRQLIQTVFENRHANTDPTAGANWGPEFKAIQEQIDAVDHAIADETKMDDAARAAASTERSPEPPTYPDA
jgi:hypothetical protein